MTNTYDFKKKDVAKLNALGAVLGAEPAPDPLTITEEDSHALTIMPPPAALTVSRAPRQVLAEAKEVSDALIELVKASPDLVKRIQDRDYLKFEAWQTIGKFYGCTAKVTETKYLELGEVKGFEAKVSVINNSGIEISAAEAMCLDDEKMWKGKPLFQLKSMAQTRASAKALRNVFAWVVVLAGYKPTPAEEMDGVKPAREQEMASWETVEGVIATPTLSGGSLWFVLRQFRGCGTADNTDVIEVDETMCIPPMVGKDMKLLLQEADKASAELRVTPLNRTKGGKEYRIVKEILKFEPDVPF